MASRGSEAKKAIIQMMNMKPLKFLRTGRKS